MHVGKSHITMQLAVPSSLHRACLPSLNTAPALHNPRIQHRLRCRSVSDESASPLCASADPAEVQDRLNKLVALIQTAELLAPYDTNEYNAALLLWTHIASIPPSVRPRLLDRLRPTCASHQYTS